MKLLRIYFPLLLLALAANPTSASEQSLLFATNALPVGSGITASPICVTAVDINSDGKLALVSANSDDYTLTVLTNNRIGGFGFHATLQVGVQPQFVAAADVNGDGKPDLICANAGAAFSYPGRLTVLTNNGSGGFGSNATYSVGSFAICVAVADINGDGKPDLVSANWNDSTLTVLTNNGSGHFGFSTDLAVGYSPRFVSAADVNGDGKPDLISANSDDGTLSIYTNNGSGGFSLSSTPQVGADVTSNPYCVAAADVNGDGKVDLISANEYENDLTLLTNNGTGGFVLQTNLPVGLHPYYVVAADLNGDGRPDLISANNSDNNMTVLTNSGGGDFVFNSTLPVGNAPCSIVAADLNSDGKMDMASANSTDGTLTLLSRITSPMLTTKVTRPGGTNQFSVSWNSYFSGFVLKTNAVMTSTNWGAASFPITVTGGTNYSITITSPPPGAIYFHLTYP